MVKPAPPKRRRPVQRPRTVPQIIAATHRLAKDVIALAEIGRMPDDYWLTDRRIGRACRQLGWTRAEARAWAKRTQRE